MTTDLYWLPICYTVQTRPTRRHGWRGRSVREDVPVTIRSVLSHDAPVIAEITGSPYEIHRSPYHSPFIPEVKVPPFSHEIREVDGKLYRNVLTPEGDRFRIEDATTFDSEKTFKDYPIGQGEAYRAKTRDQIEGELGEDSRESCIDKARQAMAETIIIDGELYRPTVEPVVELRFEGQELRGVKHYGPSLHVMTEGTKNLTSTGILFRIDEFDTARRILEQVDDQENLFIFGEVMAYDSSRLICDPNKVAFDRLKKTAEDFPTHGFRHANTDVIRLWCDAFDKLESEDIEGSLDAFDHFLNATGKTRLPNGKMNMEAIIERIRTLKPASDHAPEVLTDFSL